MARKKFSEEKILQILKEAETKPVAAVCRNHRVTGVTFYRWKARYQSLQLHEAKKLRELDEENKKLRKIVSDLTIDLHGLKEIIKKRL